MEEMLQLKYQYLKRQVINIREKLNELEGNYDDIQVALKKSILIDGKIVESKLNHEVKIDIKEIKSELNNIVIPKINSKI